ncbi:MAG: MBL fold metallo-hydrolase [Candidatus Sericytochromatia bacterium]|nr:MBL fold metallo-hydrolase [Candidatus Sericytochromatia bacterium]
MTPVQAPGRLQATWIGHATVLIQIGSKTVITDPNFNRRLVNRPRQMPPGIPFESLPAIDVVLLSHLHLDHLDQQTMRRFSGHEMLVMPKGAAGYVRRTPFTRRIELDRWQVWAEDGLTVTAVPVKHWGGRWLIDRFWNQAYTGYIIQADGATAFFPGDTAYDPDVFKAIGSRFSIDVAFMPIAPRHPRQFMKGVHADPDEAVQAFEDLGAKVMVPIHYSTFPLGTEKPHEAATWLSDLIDHRELHTRILMMPPGVSRTFA